MLGTLTDDEAKIIFFLIFEKYPEKYCQNIDVMQKIVYRYLPKDQIEEVKRIAKDRTLEASTELKRCVAALADKYGDIIMFLFLYDKEQAQQLAKDFDEIARNLTSLSICKGRHSNDHFKCLNAAIEIRELFKNYATYLK